MQGSPAWTWRATALVPAVPHGFAPAYTPQERLLNPGEAPANHLPPWVPSHRDYLISRQVAGTAIQRLAHLESCADMPDSLVDPLHSRSCQLRIPAPIILCCIAGACSRDSRLWDGLASYFKQLDQHFRGVAQLGQLHMDLQFWPHLQQLVDTRLAHLLSPAEMAHSALVLLS
jgi:hypothetical protein